MQQDLERLGVGPGRLPETARQSADALLGIVLLRDTSDTSESSPALHDVATAARLIEVRTAQIGGANSKSMGCVMRKTEKITAVKPP